MDWGVVLGTIGVLIIIKSFFLLLFPKASAKLVKYYANPGRLRRWAIISLVAGIVLLLLARNI